MSDLPTATELATELKITERHAKEIINLVMLCEPPNTGARDTLLGKITYAITIDGERWEDFRFELLLEYQFNIIYRSVKAILHALSQD